MRSRSIKLANATLFVVLCFVFAQGASYALNQHPRVALLIEFYTALENEDEARLRSLLAEGAMVHAPYNPNGDASDKAVRSFPAMGYLKMAMKVYDNLVFIDRSYSIADSGSTIWVEAKGRLRVAATNKPYHNRYVFKVEFDNDKILSITEYTNVLTLLNHGVPAQTR